MVQTACIIVHWNWLDEVICSEFWPFFPTFFIWAVWAGVWDQSGHIGRGRRVNDCGCRWFLIDDFGDEVRLVGSRVANYFWCCVGDFNESVPVSNWEHSEETDGGKEKNKVHYTGVVHVVNYVQYCLCMCQSESMMSASQRRLTFAHRCYLYQRHWGHVGLESVMIDLTWLSVLGKVTKIHRWYDPKLQSWKGVWGGSFRRAFESLVRNVSDGSQKTIWHFTITLTYQINGRRVLPPREQVG